MNKAAKLLAVLLFAVILTLSVSALESEISDYTVTAYFSAPATKFDIPRITDNDTDTRSTLLKGCVLGLFCEEDIGYVYVKFAGKPVAYTLEFYNAVTGENTVIEKDGDFMHDLTAVPVDTNEISAVNRYTSDTTNTRFVMIYSDLDMPIADIVLYSAGELPDDVQRWEKPYSECDILCFPTHADDDALFFGGLISKYVNEGRLVQTAFICNFDNDYQRRHELLNGLWAMGVKAYPIIGNFPDLYSQTLRYAKTQYNSNAMRGFITECIRRTKPSVVAAHDLDGEYGHGAHMLSASLVCESVTQSEDADFYPESAEKYGVHAPKKTFLHLYEENPLVLDVFSPTSSGITPFEYAERGYACHLSQHKWAFEVTVDDPDADLSKFGLYHSLVGYDTSSGDVLYGIEYVKPILSNMSETTDSAQSALHNALATAMHGEQAEQEDTEGSDSHRTGIIVCVALACILVLAGFIGFRRH